MPKEKTEEKKKTETKKEKETKSASKKNPTQEEFESRVIALAKQNLTSEKIGEALRQEGIHPQDFEKKISQILKSKNIYTDPDLKNVQDKLSRLEKHIENNAQDKRAIRERSRVFSQLRKIKKYRGIALK